MKRFLVTLAAVLISLGAVSAPAGAATDLSLNRRVSGPFTGTTKFDFTTSSCSFVHQVFDGRYGAAERKNHGFFHLDGCSTFRSGGFSDLDFVGTFGVVTPGRAVLRGTATGLISNAPASACPSGGFPSTFDFSLKVASGTKSFRNATDTIHVTGIWCSSMMPSNPDPINGTVSGALRHGH